MDPVATDRDFRNCPGCSNAVNINSSKQIYLIRLGEYWHEGCFCCKLCNSPISDCRYYCFEDYVCHMSCYNQKNAPERATHKPKDHIVCRVCEGLSKMLKWTLGSCKKDERQPHHLGETGQPHETVASVAGPVASASQHESTSTNDECAATNAMGAMSSIQAGTITSPQHIPVENRGGDEVKGSLGVNSSSQEQNLLGNNSNMAQISCSSSSSSCTFTQMPILGDVYFLMTKIFNAITDKWAAADVMDTMPSIQAGTITSPQESPVENRGGNEVQGSLGVNSPSQEQNLLGNNSNKAQISCTSSSRSTANSKANLDKCVLDSDLTFIFNAITAKYGDISQNCTFSSAAFKSTFWEKICSIVKTLQVTPVNDFKDYQMSEMFNSLDDIKKVGFDVEWLLRHLHKIKNIMELHKARIALQRLEDKQQEIANLIKKSIELKEEELLKLKSQMEEAIAKCHKISHEIAVSEAGLEQKHMDTLVDGLL